MQEETEVLDNPNAPHVAIFRIGYEIMEKMPTGELTGRPMKDAEKIIEVRGKTFKECEENAIWMFEELGEQSFRVLENMDDQGLWDKSRQK